MKKTLFLALAVLVSFQGLALAKEISGKVVSTDIATSKLTVSYTNPETQAEETADILVKPETAYTGVLGFADLKEGQAVVVEATEDPAMARWTAVSVKAAEEELTALDATLPGEEEVPEPAAAE